MSFLQELSLYILYSLFSLSWKKGRIVLIVIKRGNEKILRIIIYSVSQQDSRTIAF